MQTDLTNLLIQGFAGGITGYVTNNYALNMLFREYTPLKLGGVIKKTKTEFIAAISELVERDLLSPSHLKSEILKDETLEEWNRLFGSLWDEFFQAEFQQKPIQEIPGVQKALPIWIHSLVEDGLQPLQDGSLAVPEIKIESLLSKDSFSFLFKRLITQSIAEAQQGKMLDSFLISLTAPLNGKSLTDFLSRNEIENLEHTLHNFLSQSTDAIQKDPALLTDALKELTERQEIPALLANWGSKWGNQALSARLSEEQGVEWMNLIHGLLTHALEPDTLASLSTQIRDAFLSSGLLDQPIMSWFEADTQASMKEFFHEPYNRAFDQFQCFLGEQEEEIRKRLKRAAQTELDQQSGMLASMIKGPLFSYLDTMNIPNLIEGFRSLGEEKIQDALSNRPASDWIPLPTQEAVQSILQSGLIQIDEQLEKLLEKGLEKTPVQLLGENWATRYNENGKCKLLEIIVSFALSKLADHDAQNTLMSTALGSVMDQPWSQETAFTLLHTVKRLDLQPMQQAINSLDGNLYDTIKEKSIPDEIWQSILKNPNLQTSLESQGLDLMKGQIQQPLDHFLARFNQRESRDFFGERLIGMIENHGEDFLEGKVQELVKTNLQSRDEEEIVELAHDFIGRELQPITKFGFLLGVIAGIIMALFPLPKTLMIGPIDLFPIGIFALVGVTTNWIALQMIFKPYKEIRWLKKVPFFKHFSHGYLMKNQRVFAENLAQFVDESLLNRNMIQQLFSDQKKNLKQRWMDWLPTRISSWLQPQVKKGHGQLASAFTSQIQTTLSTHAEEWSNSITENLRERSIPLDNENLQNWFEENGTPLIQKGWAKWQESHQNEALSSWISPQVISAILQPILQNQAASFPTHLFWDNRDLALKPILISPFKLNKSECLEDLLFGLPVSFLRDHQDQLIPSLFEKGVNGIQNHEQSLADRLNQSVQGQLNFLQRGGFVIMGGPALLGKILHRALFDELPAFLNQNSDNLAKSFDPVIEELLVRQPSIDWKITKSSQASIGKIGKTIFNELPSLQGKLPLTEKRLNDSIHSLIEAEQAWLAPALAEGISNLSQPVLKAITIQDLLSILPNEGKTNIWRSMSSTEEYPSIIKKGWGEITHTLGRNTVIGDWIPESLMADQLNSLLHLIGSDSAFTELFETVLESAIPGVTSHLGENANLIEWLSANSFDPLYRATHAHLPALLATLSFQDHIVHEVDALSPQGIHQLFLSFAGKYFLRLEIYGLFGAVFGLHPVLPALALVSEGWETVKRKQKKGVS
jgi:uncharacterized membrane protein YheB (UPF0754 family)